MKKLILSLAALSLTGCFGAAENYTVADPVHISENTVEIVPGSKFADQLHVVPLKSAPGGERKLRTVGQMLAMANSSGELAGASKVSWVSLDSELIRSLGLILPENAPVGLAYGVTSMSANYRDEIHPGEKVEVYRYGLRQNSTTGSIVSIRAATGSENEVSVIFAIAHGGEWYPGTNCQVEFPLVQHQAVALSPLSMLHEGLREFVLKEVSPGKYLPEEITVVNETRDEVYALGDLSPGDKIVERGAILLKPIVHQVLEANQGGARVR